MSSQLVWELVKKNTCFMKHGLHGEIFSTEAGNIASKHSYKYSGEHARSSKERRTGILLVEQREMHKREIDGEGAGPFLRWQRCTPSQRCTPAADGEASSIARAKPGSLQGVIQPMRRSQPWSA